MSTGERWGRGRGRRQGRAWQGTAGAMDQACKAAGATSRGSCRGRRRSAMEAGKVLTGLYGETGWPGQAGQGLDYRSN